MKRHNLLYFIDYEKQGDYFIDPSGIIRISYGGGGIGPVFNGYVYI